MEDVAEAVLLVALAVLLALLAQGVAEGKCREAGSGSSWCVIASS